MDEETDKIKQHIDAEREQLGWMLDEIEYRVKTATDLKAHFDKNTGLILGAAVAGGFLLSLAFRKSSTSHSTQNWESASPTERSTNTTAPRAHPVSKHLHRISETIDNILDGLVGVASDKLTSFVADAVPGFQAQYDAIDRRSGRSTVHQMKRDLANQSEFSA